MKTRKQYFILSLFAAFIYGYFSGKTIKKKDIYKYISKKESIKVVLPCFLFTFLCFIVS